MFYNYSNPTRNMLFKYHVVIMCLMWSALVLADSKALPIKNTSSNGANSEKDIIKKRDIRPHNGLVPTTGKIWPPYPFAEQGYWARKSGFYGPIPDKLRDVSKLNFNNNKFSFGQSPKDYDNSQFIYDDDYSYSSEPYPDPYFSPSPLLESSSYFPQQTLNSINALSQGSFSPQDPHYSPPKDTYRVPHTFNENQFVSSSSKQIPPGKTYYRSLDLGKEGSQRIYLRAEDVFYDKKKYPFYYKPLSTHCYPYCRS
ncbi:uncharacterized protein [Lepeophtheirus salmonis]|uniref:uncharacterized protein n=1 Tax=Lepeophtheirus salmonis TaxID=72036 RepID=UPI001AE7200A|nr:uncharacterized protein LOC121116098 [Lepeophtheirus salmonis]